MESTQAALMLDLLAGKPGAAELLSDWLEERGEPRLGELNTEAERTSAVWKLLPDDVAEELAFDFLQHVVQHWRSTFKLPDQPEKRREQVANLRRILRSPDHESDDADTRSHPDDQLLRSPEHAAALTRMLVIGSGAPQMVRSAIASAQREENSIVRTAWRVFQDTTLFWLRKNPAVFSETQWQINRTAEVLREFI